LPLRWTTIWAQTLFEDRLLVVAGASSPWARRRKIAMDELLDEPWVHIPQENPVNAYYTASLKARGLTPPTPIVSTYSMHVRNHLLATGRILPYSGNGRFVSIPTADR
jgi:DNA-binding transcriptional LysR family regulator